MPNRVRWVVHAVEMCACLVVVVDLSHAYAQGRANDRDLIQMLRSAQATHRAAFRQGRTAMQVIIGKEGTPEPAIIDGVVTWRDGDFLLKYRVRDPSKLRFRSAPPKFPTDWNFLLSTRDGVRIYNAETGGLHSRPADPGQYDPIYCLNPWFLLFVCCPPNAGPAMGRDWVEMIGPHPSMSEAKASSKFDYEKLPDGSIKQVRRDKNGTVVEITFSSQCDFLISSMAGHDLKGDITQEGAFLYRHSGKDLVPVESEFYWNPRKLAAPLKFKYKFTSWDVKKPVSRTELSLEHFMRMARGLKAKKDREKEKEKTSQAKEQKLKDLSDQLRAKGFAAPR